MPRMETPPFARFQRVQPVFGVMHDGSTQTAVVNWFLVARAERRVCLRLLSRLLRPCLTFAANRVGELAFLLPSRFELADLLHYFFCWRIRSLAVARTTFEHGLRGCQGNWLPQRKNVPHEGD